MKLKALLWSLLLLVPLSLAAQEEMARSGETVQVNLVEIPVNVFDRNGEPVRGLKKENFEVYDEGKRRPITHFEEIDLATLSTSEITEVHNPAARRSFLVVFDLTNSGPAALTRAQEAAQAFLNESIRERDLVSVATFSVEHGFKILTAFTTDRELASFAIRNLGSSRFYEANDPLRLALLPMGGDTPQQAAERGFQQDTAEEVREIMRTRTEQINDQYFRQRVERQLDTFGNVAKLLDNLHGRKQIVLLSEGFSGRLIQGREHTAQQDMQVYRGEVWMIDNDQRFGSTATISRLDEMTQLFRRSDVVLHAIDIKGVAAPTDARTGLANRDSDSLYLLSNATGGQVFRHTNDLSAAFAKMLRQQEVIYILGFQAVPTGNPGKFHDLAVKVKVVGHRGLRVSNRAGYYEPRTQVSAVESALSATDILMNDLPFEEVEVNLLAAPFPEENLDTVPVPVIAEISGPDLLERVSGDQLNAEIFVYAFDDENRVKDFLFQTVNFDLGSSRPALAAKGLKYYGTLALPPGRYAIKSLVRVVESGYKGFRRVNLEIPEYGRPSVLPPLIFEDPGQWVMLKGAKTAEGQTDYPFSLLEESFIPSARPLMNSGESYKLALFTFNLPPEEMELTARIQGEDGSFRNPRLRLIGRTAPENGGVKLLLDFSPEDLKPGEYELHLSARNKSGEEAPATTLPFEIAGN